MKKRELGLLISLLVLFALLFFAGMMNLKRGTALFGIGVAPMVENLLVILLSLAGIARVFFAILKH
ncbi:MAG: hypothetical protein Q7S65_04850 [Nanoarchaeota archaeon]|nr:hypothetical protein [Nanoarchaeota archaeon]